MLLEGLTKHVLYGLRNKTNEAAKKETSGRNEFLTSQSVWHNRLTHVFEPIVNKILHSSGIKFSSNKSDVCRAYDLAKSYKIPYVSKHVSSCDPFDLVYIGVWGPSPKNGMNGEWYFLLIIDDSTRF